MTKDEKIENIIKPPELILGLFKISCDHDKWWLL
jgi:hypothetical protein